MTAPRALRVDSRAARTTERWGRLLGRLLREGDLVLLSGELGAGKTRFVKGLAEGFGAAAAAEVVSPTFLRMEEYGAPPRRLRHIDAYRMASGADLEPLGGGDLFGPGGATVIEWPERLRGALPRDGVLVTFEHRGKARRALSFSGRGARGRELVAALRAADRAAR